jgi:hypothetical protein
LHRYLTAFAFRANTRKLRGSPVHWQNKISRLPGLHSSTQEVCDRTVFRLVFARARGPDQRASNLGVSGSPGGRPTRASSLNLPVAVFEFRVSAGSCALYLLSRRTYGTVIDLWSFHPFCYPFLDAGYVSARIEC